MQTTFADIVNLWFTMKFNQKMKLIQHDFFKIDNFIFAHNNAFFF